jgi:L,D-transpeptidase YcbB
MSKAHLLSILLLLFLAHNSFFAAGSVQNVKNECKTLVDRGEETAAQLCSLIETGRLEELRWPDCSSYREQVKRFYGPSGYALLWTQEGRPTGQATRLLGLFRAAETKGLEPEDYDASRWPARLQNLSAGTRSGEELVRFDFAVTVSALRYISDLARGRINPKECQVELPEKQFDAAQFLRNEVVNAVDVEGVIGRVEPPFEGYRRALASLQHYLALARAGDGPALPLINKPLHPGDAYSGVEELAHRLRQLGDLPADAVLRSSHSYQSPLVAAIIRFQRRHGLQPDGVIGPDTFEQLVTPLARRVVQIGLVLERWRWLPPNLDSRLLVVNIPEFRLRAYDHHHLALAMRAIVGEAIRHQTPVFADQMEAIVFRPYWNVPESIQEEELVPLLRRDPGYLARNKMEVINSKEEIVATSANAEILDQLASGDLRLRQQPGPANSLGLLKFVFPNQFDIYLHGTPNRELFFRTRRDLSHGCIRIENPAALAAWVLRDRPEWTKSRIHSAMRGTKSVSIKLHARIPVLILYGTVFVENNGEAHFLADIYGHDAALEKALAATRR